MQTLSMSGKKKKIYLGATYSYTKQFTYTLPPPPPPYPQTPQKSANWPLSQHKTKNKQQGQKLKSAKFLGPESVSLRFAQFLVVIFEWITRKGIFLSFQVLYHFQCVYTASKIAYFNIDISYFLLTNIFYRTGQVYIQPNSKIVQRMLLTNTCPYNALSLY